MSFGAPSTFVRPTHGSKAIVADPAFERDFAVHLRAGRDATVLAALFERFDDGPAAFDATMQRILWRAIGVTRRRREPRR